MNMDLEMFNKACPKCKEFLLLIRFISKDEYIMRCANISCKDYNKEFNFKTK